MYFSLFVLLLSFALPALAVDEAGQFSPVGLAELAAEADLVALVQVRETDYLRRRDIPVSGSAYLRILIPYKAAAEAGDLVEVYERGLHENECYFPSPDIFEEGRRYLLFAKNDPDEEGRFRGLPAGCALDVLVDSDNRYAVRLPATGISLSDPLEELARPMTFSDAYSIVSDDDLPPALRDSMLAADQVRPYDRLPEAKPGDGTPAPPSGDAPGKEWIYTMGVELTDIRRLMAPGIRTKD